MKNESSFQIYIKLFSDIKYKFKGCEINGKNSTYMSTPNHKMCKFSSTSKTKPVFFRKKQKRFFSYFIFFVLFAKQFFSFFIVYDSYRVRQSSYFQNYLLYDVKPERKSGKKMVEGENFRRKVARGITERDWSKDVWLGNYKSDQNLILRMRLFHSWQYQN